MTFSHLNNNSIRNKTSSLREVVLENVDIQVQAEIVPHSSVSFSRVS